MLDVARPASVAPRVADSLADTKLATPAWLSEAELDALAGCALTRREVRAGADLSRDGEQGDAMMFLARGWACQHKTTRDGRRQIAALKLAGEMVNLDALWLVRMDCGVRTLTPATVLSVPRERVAALCAAHPGIARAAAWLGATENAILSRWTLCLGRLTARERLAHLLCELAVRSGRRMDAGEVAYPMPLTQDHLSDVLGLTPVHVNRTLQQLRAEGMVRTPGREVVAPDIAVLRRTAGFDPGYLHG